MIGTALPKMLIDCAEETPPPLKNEKDKINNSDRVWRILSTLSLVIIDGALRTELTLRSSGRGERVCQGAAKDEDVRPSSCLLRNRMGGHASGARFRRMRRCEASSLMMVNLPAGDGRRPQKFYSFAPAQKGLASPGIFHSREKYQPVISDHTGKSPSVIYPPLAFTSCAPNLSATQRQSALTLHNA